ncbi:sialate O-acetylesterase [Chitinophaga arvensicola]|uniref:Sialate O-acetylesterase n=1 Tax=Chitinophaga arvensicola TaxID=29529 RepID=A0A1I0S7E3_9BACT|nr:sialate O-acetylesterase [Chitinophaga arvensicola]SEW51667.1 sialate O-acetylesterase [Chitinophaga arvensicola]
MKKYKYLFPFLIALLSITATAQLKLPAIIGDNMVLQQGQKDPVWGWADPGEKISVAFRDQRYEATAGADGKWMIHLRASAAGGPFSMVITANSQTIRLSNIWIGEVWLASGQSNMEFGIQTDSCGKAAIETATDSLIHFFVVPMTFSLHPEKDITAPANSQNGKWVVCSPELLATPGFAWHGFSAVGYYFARELRKSTNAPVGMIGSYKGGTPAQAWMSTAGLSAQPAFSRYLDMHQQYLDHYEDAKRDYPAKKGAFQEALKKWDKASGEPRPKEPLAPEGGFNAPTNLYNAMIAPLVPYGIRGVIWYQGESNGDRLEEAVTYRQLFPALIANWRHHWQQGNFPFLFVQLANFRTPAQLPSEGIWPWVREAQLKTLDIPRTGMAVITDVGNAKDIHPTDKLDVGLRLSLVARATVYGEKIVYTGPLYRSMKVSGSQVILRFTGVGTGLAAGKNADTAALRGFGVAGSDGRFEWANARISGNEVIVESSKVPHPVAVRYNWADNPPGNLYNKEGLPASSFRTDNYPASVQP